MSDPDQRSLYDVYCHDARDLQAHLERTFGNTDELVDAVVTSPPYADLVDYGDQEEQVGRQEYESFLSDLKTVFRQCYEVAADECTLWVITDTLKRNNRLIRLPFDIADEVENLQGLEWCQDDTCGGHLRRNRETGQLHCPECGATYDPLAESWRMEDHVIWNKQRTRPWRRRGQLRNVYEHVSMFSKSADFQYDIDAIRMTETEEFGRWWVDYPERYNPAGMVPGNVWEYEIPKQGEWGPGESFHPSPFPEGLVERILRLATDPGDVVLDPFAGIGTTLAVADALDRKPLGYELNQEYIEYYQEHVLPAVRQAHNHEQQTFADPAAETRQTIWTLRIHKYALELFRLIAGQKDPKGSEESVTDLLDALPQMELTDVKFILVHADADKLAQTETTPPSASLQYVCGDDVPVTDIPITMAREGLRSETPSSGDYYEVDFDISFQTLADYREHTTEELKLYTDSDTIYVYTGGKHYWFDESLAVTDWWSLSREGRWRRFRASGRPPLLSNLRLRVENPMSDQDPTETGQQTDIEWFSNDL